jgi:O-antigen/teichoic acid export membrane protein
MSAARRSLSEEAWGATLWNTLLLPARVLVGLVASVIYYQQLTLEQVGLIFVLSNLGSTIGLWADLGVERALPRFLPEVEQQSGWTGVRRFMLWVLRVKLLILLVPLAGLGLLADPLSRHLTHRQRAEIAQLEEQAREIDAQPGSSAQAATIQRKIDGARSLVVELERRGPFFLAAVGGLVVLGALFDLQMQFLTAFFRRKAWNLITLASTLLQPIFVTAFVLLGWGLSGVLVGLLVAPVASVLLAYREVLRASGGLAGGAVSAPLDPTLPRRFARLASVSYLIQGTIWLFDVQFVVIMSAALLPLHDVALLGFALKLGKDFLGYVWTPLNGVVVPLLTRVRALGSHAALVDAHASLTRLVWLLLIPAATGLAFLAPAVIATLYPKYVDAVAIAVVCLGFSFLEPMLAIPLNLLLVCERYKAVVVSRLLTLLGIPLLFLAVPQLGLMGVVLTAGLVRLGSLLVTVVYGARHMGLRLPLGFGARVTGASACAGGLMWLLARIQPWQAGPLEDGRKLLYLVPLAGCAVLGGAAFVVGFRLAGGLHADERRRLLGLQLPFKRWIARLV